MLRPTLKELLTGLLGTVQQTLVPELTSPYAQGQVMSLIGMLLHAADSLERERHYNEGELRDLHMTIRALKRLGKSHLKRGSGDLKKILLRSVKGINRAGASRNKSHPVGICNRARTRQTR